jgi:hypothetical protein
MLSTRQVDIRLRGVSALVEVSGGKGMSSIFRRGKTFWCRARRNGIEHRRSLKTTNRAVAERRFREWLDQLDKLAWGEKPEYTYAAAEEKFIREHLTTLKPRSAKRYGDSLKHLAGHFGAMTLAAITSSELSSFETKRRGDGVTPSTIRRDFARLSSLMTSCLEWEWIDSNPVPPYLRRRARRGLEWPHRRLLMTRCGPFDSQNFNKVLPIVPASRGVRSCRVGF